MPDLFFEIHRRLPREGPGDDESTRQALARLELPPQPAILDIGCGPGKQTLALAHASHGRLIAVDTHRPFLESLRQEALKAGLAGQVDLLEASMQALPLPDGLFDAVWSEGAVYIMGFSAGLRAWRRLIKPGGYLVVTEITWLKPHPPEEVYRFWLDDYPGMADLPTNLARVAAAGYRLVDHFVLPDASWWVGYYGPLEARLAHLERKYARDPYALQFLRNAQWEIEIYRRYAAWYGYVFYVMQKPLSERGSEAEILGGPR